ncbi:hypothetical protein UT300007_07290 [Clostridium sp. CTA-7]|jgi:hypothetical protein
MDKDINITNNNYINFKIIIEVIYMSKMMRNMAAGAVLGVAVSAMILPQLDKKSQRNMKRAGRRAMNMAGDAYDTIMGYMK